MELMDNTIFNDNFQERKISEGWTNGKDMPQDQVIESSQKRLDLVLNHYWNGVEDRWMPKSKPFDLQGQPNITFGFNLHHGLIVYINGKQYDNDALIQIKKSYSTAQHGYLVPVRFVFEMKVFFSGTFQYLKNIPQKIEKYKVISGEFNNPSSFFLDRNGFRKNYIGEMTEKLIKSCRLTRKNNSDYVKGTLRGVKHDNPAATLKLQGKPFDYKPDPIVFSKSKRDKVMAVDFTLIDYSTGGK
ncbi:MAG: hypothetical protein ACR2PE_05195 [Porticoccus sp.]